MTMRTGCARWPEWKMSRKKNNFSLKNKNFIKEKLDDGSLLVNSKEKTSNEQDESYTTRENKNKLKNSISLLTPTGVVQIKIYKNPLTMKKSVLQSVFSIE